MKDPGQIVRKGIYYYQVPWAAAVVDVFDRPLFAVVEQFVLAVYPIVAHTDRATLAYLW